MKSNLIELINSTGETMRAERFEQLVPVAAIAHAQRFQDYCKTCPHYGKNLACPPSTPYFTDYVGKARTARVICYKVHLAAPQTTTADEQRAEIRKAGQFLAEELKPYLKQGHKVAGAGFCRACPTCAAEVGSNACNKPAERIFSLEAMGIDVAALIKQSFGFGLEWNTGTQRASYLCAAGAVFYDEKQAAHLHFDTPAE